MFLRSLQIRGFKSFADKTVLEFAPGVSVIVGPNGSGKSNLVDAISWVLGEQGARALRGGQMADVIFAGSPQRSGLGMAEVRLVIDNSAGLIPVPMTEIEISRTILRTGDSDYRIGGQVVRQLDVQIQLVQPADDRDRHEVTGLVAGHRADAASHAAACHHSQCRPHTRADSAQHGLLHHARR